jgi:hypothetical protein
LSLVAFSCTNIEQEVSATDHKAGDSELKSEQKDSQRTTTSKDRPSLKEVTDELAAGILGTWAMVGMENASFVIETNNIVYPESSASYRYSLVNDTLKIQYDDYVGSFAIKLKNKDTMLLSGTEEQVYYRFK